MTNAAEWRCHVTRLGCHSGAHFGLFVFLSWLSCLPPPPPSFFCVFFLAPSVHDARRDLRLPTQRLLITDQPHINIRTRLFTHPPRLSVTPRGAAGRSQPVCLSACQSVSGPKRTHSRHRITPSSATRPPTVPTHRSMTAPGERQRANADRKRFDSFVNYIYGFFFFHNFVFKYLRVKSRLNRMDVFHFYPV